MRLKPERVFVSREREREREKERKKERKREREIWCMCVCAFQRGWRALHKKPPDATLSNRKPPLQESGAVPML